MTTHPRESQTLIGHDSIFSEVLRAWQRGAFPQAHLVSGPSGVGKATFVYRLARRLLSSGAQSHGDSHTERFIAAGEHPDLLALEPPDGGPGKQAVIRVDDVRRASHFCALGCAQAAWRIVVVDPADALNANAANALLKDLEEPPPRVLFFLVSHMPARLPATIRSRCATLRLGPLSDEETARVLYSNRPESCDADVLARLAGGAPGRAIALADADAAVLYQAFLAPLRRAPNHEPLTWPHLADRMAGDAPTFRFSAMLVRRFLNKMVRTTVTRQPPPDATEHEASAMMNLGPGADLEHWLAVWDKASRIFDRAESANLDRRQVMLTVFLDIETAARGGSVSGRSMDAVETERPA